VENVLGGTKPTTLLTVLLTNANRRVSTEALLEALWPGKQSPGAGSTLESHIWRVRRVLEPNRSSGDAPRVLTNDVGGYRLVVDDADVDSRRFEQLVDQVRGLTADGEPAAALALCNEALGLWRGRPYEALADSEMVAPIIARLDESAAEIQERRLDALLGLGQTEEALAALVELLDAAPFREKLWGLRMLGLYRSGRTEEALSTYQQARSVLLDQIGVEPGPELRELHQRILNQDPVLLEVTEADRATEPTGARLQFRVLGPLEVLCDGVRLDLGPPKQRAVLAKLVLARGEVVSADQLITALWSGEPPPRALASLQAYVSKLRSLLHGIVDGGARLERRAPGYALDIDSLDVAEFRRLADQAAAAVAARHWEAADRFANAALHLWRGSLLADLLETWVDAQAARLDEPRGRCFEIQVTALLGQSRIADAVDRSHALVEAFPNREHARWLRMISLHRAGRSPEALEAYQDYARRLDRELGLQPGRELRDLQTAILRHDSTIASWPDMPIGEPPTPRPSAGHLAVGRPPSASGAGPGESASARSGLTVGRTRELAIVDEVLADVVAGHSRWLLLSGPAGIGKTRLAEEARRRFRDRGLRVIWTSCPDDDGVPAWWPLRPLVADLDEDPDAVFVPPSGVDADSIRFRVYESLSVVLTKAAAEEPLLIVVDDVQWLDAASVRCLAHLVRSLRSSRIAVVLTRRDGEDRGGLEPLLTSFSRHDGSVFLAIGPLDGAGSTALLNQVAGETLSASEAFKLTDRTGGNPLLLTEYARLPREERSTGAVPLAAHTLFERRLGRLAEPVLVVLRGAAVIGEVFELDLLADVVGLRLPELVDVLDQAEQDAVIVPAHTGHGYQFAHGLLRDEVLAHISTMRRQALHARVADELARREGGPRTLVQRAQHLAAAGAMVDPRAVVEACAIAARDADSRWDWDVAAHQWAAALAASENVAAQDERDDLLIAQLTALARAGRGQTVLDTVDVALEEASRRGRIATIGRLAAALLRTSGAWPWTAPGSDPSHVVNRLTQLSATITDDVATEVRVLAALAVGNCYASDISGPESLSSRALSLAHQSEDPELIADAIMGRILTFAGVAAHSEETHALLEQIPGLPHAQAAIDDVLRHDVSTMALFHMGDIDGVAHHLRAGIASSVQQRLPVVRVQLRWAEATLAQWHGELDRAEELIGTAFELHRQTELYGSEISFLSSYLCLLWDRGQVANAPDAVSRSHNPLVWRTVAAAETGDARRGRQLLRECLSEVWPDYWFTLGYLTLLGHAAADLADSESARILLDRLQPHDRHLTTIGQIGSLGPVALVTGRLRALLGDLDGAQRDLAVAEDLARNGEGMTALVRIGVAQAWLEAASPARRTTLADLADQADRLGLTHVAEQARQHR
jgi:DNA-binding SARP family transcriptional activator